MIKIRSMLKAASLLFWLSATHSVFAEEQAPQEKEQSIAKPETEIQINSDQAESETDTPKPEAKPAQTQNTLGGAGLRERKLSDVFEQFVPSETISADNAVPFPTDI